MVSEISEELYEEMDGTSEQCSQLLCPEWHLQDPGGLLLINSMQGGRVATVFSTAEQNAFPNASSAHARQLDGSPEQIGPEGGLDSRVSVNTWIGKMELTALGVARRRSGTGGLYEGKLSRIDREGRRGWAAASSWTTLGMTIEEKSSDLKVVVNVERSAACWAASSRQTQGVSSLQKPQSNVGKEEAGSEGIDLEG